MGKDGQSISILKSAMNPSWDGFPAKKTYDKVARRCKTKSAVRLDLLPLANLLLRMQPNSSLPGFEDSVPVFPTVTAVGNWPCSNPKKISQDWLKGTE